VVNITLSVPQDMKTKMDHFSEMNWSEVARKAIAEKLRLMGMLERITAESALTDKDVEEIGSKIKAGIAKAHERRV